MIRGCQWSVNKSSAHIAGLHWTSLQAMLLQHCGPAVHQNCCGPADTVTGVFWIQKEEKHCCVWTSQFCALCVLNTWNELIMKMSYLLICLYLLSLRPFTDYGEVCVKLATCDTRIRYSLSIKKEGKKRLFISPLCISAYHSNVWIFSIFMQFCINVICEEDTVETHVLISLAWL